MFTYTRSEREWVRKTKALRTENLNVKCLRRFLGAASIVNRCAQTVLALIPKNAYHFTDFPIAHQ